MIYENISKGIFLKRPNRFIAHVDLGNGPEICHVKNTGRCAELLIPGVTVFVSKSSNPARKTKYDLISVYKGNRLINIDSQAPNKIVWEWIAKDGFLPGITLLKPEFTIGNSRFDFYAQSAGKKIIIEVKGVTLENNNIVSFPDAPTERGTKHMNELSRLASEGFCAYVIFVVQMNGVRCFMPNRIIDPVFSEALINAEKSGVSVMAIDCRVTDNSVTAGNELPVVLH
ncbi:MAG: DNA/RNA nuclease SfsA [Clostridia bacterium]|nr:DNA/RNA nuclease SfsA [Clostridia bacterium]